jgi:hypothetical protein
LSSNLREDIEMTNIWHHFFLLSDELDTVLFLERYPLLTIFLFEIISLRLNLLNRKHLIEVIIKFIKNNKFLNYAKIWQLLFEVGYFDKFKVRSMITLLYVNSLLTLIVIIRHCQ